MNTITSSSEQATRLPRPTEEQVRAPKDKSAQLQKEEDCTEFAKNISAVLDFALFPDAVKFVNASAMCVPYKSDTFLWIKKQIV